MLQNEVRRAVLQERLNENVERAVADLRNSREELRAREEKLEEEFAAAEGEALRLDRMAIDYKVLRRQMEGDRATYDQILTRLNETTIASKLQNTNLRILDSARPSAAPIVPDRKRIFLFAALLFVGVMTGLPIGLETFDNKLKSQWDVDHFLKKELLAEIHLLTKMKKTELACAVLNQAENAVVESFRALYSQILTLSDIETPKAILISSTVPSEGKTFLTSNLGATFARHGKRTLLIDTDFRRPRLHSIFGLKNDQGIIRWLEAGGQLHSEKGLAGDPDLGITGVAELLLVLRAGGLLQTSHRDDGRSPL